MAIATGQKLGKAKITMAPSASTASARTIAPLLAWVSSIAAPIGVCTDRPSRPPTVVTKPDLGLAPVLLGDQEHVQVGPERPPHIGEQEIDGVERARMKARLLRGRRHSHIQSVPITSVMMVSGAPTRK